MNQQQFLLDIKTAFEAKYVKIPTGEKKDNQIWTLTFNKESDKLPLVLIHGFASGVGLWCLNLDAFAAQRPVYAFDLLGICQIQHYFSTSRSQCDIYRVWEELKICIQ